jgi:hypothetical protein
MSPPPTPDQLGRFAEMLAATALIRPFDRGARPVPFRATYLGDKYPAVDFLVDLLAADDSSRGFFFVQVKGTISATPAHPRLAIDVPRDRFNRLVEITAPTYLIGVDLATEVPYVVAAYRRRRTPVSSITKAFPLTDDAVRVKLYREVRTFWTAHKPLLLQTGFKDV